MKVAIDVSPLKSGHYLQHRVRGTGFYLTNLRDSLEKYFPQNDYLDFSRGESIPSGSQVVHYPYFEPFFLTLPFSKKMKSVVTVHDLTPLVFPNNFPAGIKGKIKWKIQKRNLRKMDGIITDSLSSKKDIEKYTGISEEKISVVYLAASSDYRKLDKVPSNTKKKYNLPDKFVLYVGDVTWNKNLPRLINACIKGNFPLVIVGGAFANEKYDKNSPWNQDLNKAQNAAKEGGVTSLGFIDNKDLNDIYNLATLFAMPSLYEGFGLPILEAMQSGCPVITSERGSLKEVGGESVYFVDPERIESIQDGIKLFFGNEKIRQEYASKGIEQAKKFSWEKTAKETVRVYEQVAQDA